MNSGAVVSRHSKTLFPKAVSSIVISCGTVGFSDDAGGYGVISTDDGDLDGEDVFFHTVDIGGEGLGEGLESEVDNEPFPERRLRDEPRPQLTTTFALDDFSTSLIDYEGDHFLTLACEFEG